MTIERRTAKELLAARELLESCRPGRNDLAEPEMADAVRALAEDPQLRAAFDRLQRQDLLLSRAFQQVEVPDGLEQRLLARLVEMQPAPAEIGLPSQSGSSGSESAPPKSSPRSARRKWLVASLAMAGSLLLLFGWFSQRPITPTIDVLASRSLQWTVDLQSLPAESWQEFHESEFPQLRWRPRRWQALPTKLDAEVVVFDFGSTRDRQLLLYQFKTRHTLPLPKIPYQSLTVTGAWQSGAWQEGEHVYVAVTSDPRLLESLRRAYSAT
jgi:hypothetical protein